jgi:hypothetical protein
MLLLYNIHIFLTTLYCTFSYLSLLSWFMTNVCTYSQKNSLWLKLLIEVCCALDQSVNISRNLLLLDASVDLSLWKIDLNFVKTLRVKPWTGVYRITTTSSSSSSPMIGEVFFTIWIRIYTYPNFSASWNVFKPALCLLAYRSWTDIFILLCWFLDKEFILSLLA